MSSLNDLTYKFLNREETTALDSAVLYLSKTNKEVAEEAAQELSAMQARIQELEKMVIGLDTMQRAPKGCQYKTVYNESGELVAVVEVIGTPATIAWTTPTRLAK